ncbi:hypothetical protein FIBSPDRAFT_765309, partial [Athelia psychrophila]
VTGEMRKTDGSVAFGGSAAYSSQTPRIRNTTLRENIRLGNKMSRKGGLARDLDRLLRGEITEAGKKGRDSCGELICILNWRARVSIARAAYSGSDAVLLDDSLSAVDTHAEKAMLEICILDGPLASKTRILITHAPLLNRTDYIYVMDSGTPQNIGRTQ